MVVCAALNCDIRYGQGVSMFAFFIFESLSNCTLSHYMRCLEKKEGRGHVNLDPLNFSQGSPTVTGGIRLLWSSTRSIDTHNLCHEFGSGAVTTCFYDVGLWLLGFNI